MAEVATHGQLMAEQARAAVRVSGADHSSWTGEVSATAAGEDTIRGRCTWAGGIQYNPQKVTEPLQEMFRNARAHNQDPEVLGEYRQAVKTVLHENVHLLAAAGTDHRDGQAAYQTPAVKVLEEGVTEAYSNQRLNDYIDDLGLDKVAPGIRAATAGQSYRQYTPAAETFANSIGRRSGVGGDEVMRRMATVGAHQKFRVAAETVFDNSDLRQLMPESERAAAVQRIEAAMKPSFEAVASLGGTDQAATRRKSSLAGAEAAQAGYDQVRALEQQWSQPAPEAMRQASQQRGPHEAGAQADPDRTGQRGTGQAEDRQPETGQGRSGQVGNVQAGTVQVGAGRVGTGQTASGQVEPSSARPGQASGRNGQPRDLQHAMRAGLSGTPPLAGAHRLTPDRQGSRRGTVPSGPQREGPTPHGSGRDI